MNRNSIISREAKILGSLKHNFSATDIVLSEIIRDFGEDLRTSVELGYPDDAIAWDLFSRWQERREGFEERTAA